MAAPRSGRKARALPATVALFALSAAVWVSAGCESNGRTETPYSGAAQVGSAIGDWEDVDNAVNVAATKTEMAVVEARDEGPNHREYDLLTSTDEPAHVRVRRHPRSTNAAEGRDAASEWNVEAHVGRFGNPKVERALLDHIKDRLLDLAGVDFAPVR